MIARIGQLTILNNSSVSGQNLIIILIIGYTGELFKMGGRGGGGFGVGMEREGGRSCALKKKILQVSVRERQLAERQYLKEYAQEWMESQTDESKRLLFNQQHPRFANLFKGLYTHPKIINVCVLPVAASVIMKVVGRGGVLSGTIIVVVFFSAVEQGLPEDALVAQKPATTALKHGLICILINFKILFNLLPLIFTRHLFPMTLYMFLFHACT